MLLRLVQDMSETQAKDSACTSGKQPASSTNTHTLHFKVVLHRAQGPDTFFTFFGHGRAVHLNPSPLDPCLHALNSKISGKKNCWGGRHDMSCGTARRLSSLHRANKER